jgi:enoyl-CoA hydratase/carnithine racemase
MGNYAKFMDLIGPSRLTEMVLRARLMSASEALAAGFVHEIVPADAIEAKVREIAKQVASHAPITMYVTKESIRRLQAARKLPDGEDLVSLTYGSEDFKEGVRAFVEKRPPRWTGK